MGQTLDGIRASIPDPKTFQTTVAASTLDLELYQRMVVVDATTGANTLTINMPPPGGIAEGVTVGIRVSGSTGGVKVFTTSTSFAISAGTAEERMDLYSNGYQWLAVFSDAD